MRTIKRNKILGSCNFDWPPELKPDYAINPYIGCQHDCHWGDMGCWAKDMAKRFGKSWGYPAWFVDNIEAEWKNALVVENVLELLEAEMGQRKPGRVLLSSMTDPYQPIEAIEFLTARALSMIPVLPGWESIVLTKAIDLPYRDLHQWENHPFTLGLTIMNEDDWARKALLRQAFLGRIPTFVSLEPWLPGVSAQNIITLNLPYVDFWILGSLNKSGKAVNTEFYKWELPPLAEWMDKEGIQYYIKKELRRAASLE